MIRTKEIWIAVLIVALVAIQAFRCDISLYLYGDVNHMVGGVQKAKVFYWYLPESIIILLLTILVKSKYSKPDKLYYFWHFMVCLAIGKVCDEFTTPYKFTIREEFWIAFSIIFVARKMYIDFVKDWLMARIFRIKKHGKNG